MIDFHRGRLLRQHTVPVTAHLATKCRSTRFVVVAYWQEESTRTLKRKNRTAHMNKMRQKRYSEGSRRSQKLPDGGGKIDLSRQNFAKRSWGNM